MQAGNLCPWCRAFALRGGAPPYPLGCGHAVRCLRSTLQVIRSQIEPECCPMGLEEAPSIVQVRSIHPNALISMHPALQNARLPVDARSRRRLEGQSSFWYSRQGWPSTLPSAVGGRSPTPVIKRFWCNEKSAKSPTEVGLPNLVRTQRSSAPIDPRKQSRGHCHIDTPLRQYRNPSDRVPMISHFYKRNVIEILAGSEHYTFPGG